MRIKEPFVLEEVIALVKFISERGLEPKGKIITPLSQALTVYQKAVNSTEQNDLTEEQRSNSAKEILVLYNQLTALTYATPVANERGLQRINGKTLLDTSKALKYSILLMSFSITFMLLAFITEGVDISIAKSGNSVTVLPPIMINLHNVLLDHLSPFFWGGLGACIFLMKKFSDKIATQSFDKSDMKGWANRLMLGAILGTVSVYIYAPESFIEDGLHLDANAVAFFSGLSVKLIYGVFEKSIETLYNKLELGKQNRDLEPKKTQKESTVPIKEVINE